MGDVAGWLNGLGLGRYAASFAVHEIDFDALPHLTEAMLEEIGLPIGPRAKVLAAIAALAPADPAPVRSGDAGARPAAADHPPERRQMTVMFCDLVDSTRLASAHDPEDFRALMQAYQRACGAVIERYEGHVAQYRGDGIEVYFGWPAAQEDAAERAVRAALEVVRAVAAIRDPVPLSVRIGIGTGIVVIGATGMGDPSTPSGAVGDTPHLAARLQALASPGAVVIADTTRRLLSTHFEVEPLGPQTLKGISGQIEAYRVRDVRDDASRFQGHHAGSLTPLVGRRTELALLQQRWRDARDGDGQVVYLLGVPGVGKSRIAYELEQSLAAEPHFSLHFQCLPHHVQSPLFPVIQQLRRLADIAESDSDPRKVDKIERLIERTGEQRDRAVPLVAALLSVAAAPRYPALEQSTLELKARTQLVLADMLLGLSARSPVFCLIEDAQWIDASTQEALELLTDRVGRVRFLLLITHRPEYQPRSGLSGNVSALTIGRLARRDTAELAQLALRGNAVSASVLQRIVEESDSIPLFVEELARGVTGAERSGGQDDGVVPSASWSVPESLRDSLMARLDRAPRSRNVAQIAAVLGREFSYDLLRRVAALEKPELDASIAHLEQSEIIQRIGSGGDGQLAFKHALVRDAAYESLLKSVRRDLHHRVAAAIESDRPETVAAQPELLAYHYTLAADLQAAVRYWVLGGERARGQSALVEAASQFSKALELLDSLPRSAQRDATELDISLALGFCLIAVRGYSAEETRDVFERARILGARQGVREKEVRAVFGLWGHHWMRAQHRAARALAETLLNRGEALADDTVRLVGHRALGSTLFTLGDFVGARDHLERAIALPGRRAGSGSARAFAVDPRIAAQLLLAWDLWVLGQPDQALEHVLRALGDATRQGDPYSVAFCHYVTSAVHLLRGEPVESLGHADRSLALATKHRINLYALYSRFGRGCALAAMGRADEGGREIRAGIGEADRSNLGYMRGFMLGWLATVKAQSGDPEGALATVQDALVRTDDDSGRAWEAELLRLKGECLLAAHPENADDAEGCYRTALAVAGGQSARSLELRAGLSLARLLRERGRDDEGRAILRSVYGWFSEGFDTADLRAAAELLG